MLVWLSTLCNAMSIFLCVGCVLYHVITVFVHPIFYNPCKFLMIMVDYELHNKIIILEFIVM